jgi:hypothetical protein
VITFEYLYSRRYASKGKNWEKALTHWSSLPSDAEASFDREVRIDLERQELIAPDGITHQFPIDPTHKERLLKGLDDIALILKNIKTIEVYEESYYRDAPWLAWYSVLSRPFVRTDGYRHPPEGRQM